MNRRQFIKTALGAIASLFAGRLEPPSGGSVPESEDLWITTDSPIFTDSPLFIVGTGNPSPFDGVVFWQHSPNERIVSYSDDGGLTWSESLPFTLTDSEGKVYSSDDGLIWVGETP